VAVLHAVEGPLRGQRFPIPNKPKIIVGRYEVYDLIVPDPSISRKHFAFERRAEGLYLIDLGSLNGTQLNGLRVSTAKLEQGDRITAGQTVLVFDESDGSEAPAGVIEEVGEIEMLDDNDVLEDGPISLDLPASASAPASQPVSRSTPAMSARPSGRTDASAGNRVTERLLSAKPPSGRSGSSQAVAVGGEPCAACARQVPPEEVAGGEGAKTRVGYVCGRCVERRQKTGQKGSLEKFIRECQRKRK
jgi:pSer/pThr/pTyr-binding forkhead associated (FHA) protein